MLSVPLFVGFALVAIVALVLLKQTWLFWLPGVALVGYGGAIYCAWPWYDTHEDVGGLEGLSNLLHVVISVVVVAGGIVFLIVGARTRGRVRRTELPAAIVTTDSDRRKTSGQ